MASSEVTQVDIVQGLRALGLAAGAGVMVHSSLRSFGQVRGGALAVIEALKEVLTPAGTLLMPSFNHGRPFNEGKAGYYDPRETPTPNGLIPETFWRLPGVVRSLNPTHPFAAWGEKARAYLQGHHRVLAMGPGSPLGLLHADDGRCLLIGVDYAPNTFKHVVETTMQVPCLGPRTEAYPVRLPEGRIVMGRTWGWREKSCPLSEPSRYAASEMEAQKRHRVGQIGASRLLLFRLRDFFEVLSDILTHGRDSLPPCSKCPVRPRRVPQTVPSDWDPVKRMLLPDSVAWTY